MFNPVLSRLAGQNVLVSPAHEQWFASCIKQASGVLEQFQADSRIGEVKADSFWPAEGSWLSQFRPYTVKNGILSIPVAGGLINGFPYTFYGILTGYEYISEALKRGLADPAVKGIVFAIDSPGGEVSGNFDLVDKIFEARAVKPIKAVASEHAYSAAYSIASAAEDITVARTGGVGSIGVVTMHIDYSQMLEDEGIKVTFIHAGKHKVDGNPYEPLPESVKNRIQENIDSIYNLFVETVARNRDMDEAEVRATEALTFNAADSLSVGLADAIGSMEEAMAAFSAKVNTNQGSNTMTTPNEDVTAKIEAAKTEAKAAGKAEGMKEGTAAGAKAERERITGIMSAPEAAKRQASALKIATTTDMTVEQASGLLAGLPEEATKATNEAFVKAMNEGKNPEVGADGGSTETADMSGVDTMIADYKAAGGMGLKKSK